MAITGFAQIKASTRSIFEKINSSIYFAMLK